MSSVIKVPFKEATVGQNEPFAKTAADANDLIPRDLEH